MQHQPGGDDDCDGKTDEAMDYDGVVFKGDIDLNGDGWKDLVFSELGNYSTIYWGSCSGFDENNKFILPSVGAIDVAVADLNNNGYLDIIHAN